MSELKNYTVETLKEDINKKTLIKFEANYCGSCKMLNPIMERLAKENDSINFGKVDIEEFPILASQYNIQGLPTLIFFEDGKEVTRLIGVYTEQKIREVIK